MATQEFNLGSQPFGAGNDEAWAGSLLVDAVLVSGGAVSYLREISTVAGFLQLSTAINATENVADAGPEFTPEWETSAMSVTLSEAGGTAVILKGPDHPDTVFRDATEPYLWQPDNFNNVTAWFTTLGAGIVTLTLDDGGTTTATDLELDDWVQPANTNAPIAALFTAGTLPNFYREGSEGTLIEGDVELETGQNINRIRVRANNGNDLSLYDDNTSIEIGTYFDTGDGADATVYLQTASSVESFNVSAITVFPTNARVEFRGIPQAFYDLAVGLAADERFILAITIPTTVLSAPSFIDDTGDAQNWTQNDAITPLVVPAANGNPVPAYAVVGALPTGIAFAVATRTISGTPTVIGSGTITIRATNSEGTADWTVDYATTVIPYQVGAWIDVDVAVSPYNVTGLVAGHRYEVQVAAVNSEGTGAYTNSEEITIT